MTAAATPSSVQRLAPDPTEPRALRVAMILPGLHRVGRGAEVAFEAVACHLGAMPGFDVTLIGSGAPRLGVPYRYHRAPAADRMWFERWPSLPLFRDECAYEELTFAAAAARVYRPAAYDITMTCGYPFLNWMLRVRTHRGRRPRHVFVTQNSDHPASCDRREFAWFGCDGLVCTNNVYYDRNRDRYRCRLIPNGIDAGRFVPGPGERATLGFDPERPLVLVVSALIASKRVSDAIEAVRPMCGVQLCVLGDGPLRELIERQGRAALGGRFGRRTVPPQQMPEVYRAADVLLHMSRGEAFGNVYAEAMSCGLPVVAHDWAMTRWLLGPAGRLVDTDDPGAVRAALTEALAERDPSESGRRHRLAAERFDWPIVAEAYADFLREVAHIGPMGGRL